MNAARLQQLHEVWQPQPVSWAPQTAGWYLLFLGLIVVALWTALRAWQRWKQIATAERPCGKSNRARMNKLMSS
jgi:hypothetical protein